MAEERKTTTWPAALTLSVIAMSVALALVFGQCGGGLISVTGATDDCRALCSPLSPAQLRVEHKVVTCTCVAPEADCGLEEMEP